MRRSSAETKDHILAVSDRLIYRGGFARVSLDAIADAANVTKRTLYNHFERKDALIGAVLERQHHNALAHIQKWASASAASPADYVSAIFERLERWVGESNWLGSGFTRLTMELGNLPGHPARQAARAHKLAVEAWLTSDSDALGAKNANELARGVLYLIEGAVSFVLIHGNAEYVASARQAAVTLAAHHTK